MDMKHIQHMCKLCEKNFLYSLNWDWDLESHKVVISEQAFGSLTVYTTPTGVFCEYSSSYGTIHKILANYLSPEETGGWYIDNLWALCHMRKC